MQRFAFPPQIRPAWKRQKSKNMVACEASLFRTAKFGKKIQLSQKINHYHTSETAESCFFVAHESQECNHCALVWQCVPSRHLTPKIPGQKSEGRAVWRVPRAIQQKYTVLMWCNYWIKCLYTVCLLLNRYSTSRRRTLQVFFKRTDLVVYITQQLSL